MSLTIEYFKSICIKSDKVRWSTDMYPYPVVDGFFFINKEYVCGKHPNFEFIRVYDSFRKDFPYSDCYTDILIENFSLNFVDLKKYRKMKLDKINENI